MCPCEIGGDNTFLGLHWPEPRTEAQSQTVSISSVHPIPPSTGVAQCTMYMYGASGPPATPLPAPYSQHKVCTQFQTMTGFITPRYKMVWNTYYITCRDEHKLRKTDYDGKRRACLKGSVVGEPWQTMLGVWKKSWGRSLSVLRAWGEGELFKVPRHPGVVNGVLFWSMGKRIEVTSRPRDRKSGFQSQFCLKVPS